MGNKVIIIFINLTSQNRGLSGLKNILPVIMTGDLLSVILSLGGGGMANLTINTVFSFQKYVLNFYAVDCYRYRCVLPT